MKLYTNILLPLIMMSVLLVASCGTEDSKQTDEQKKNLPAMIMQIKKCSRLYTTELKVHKIVTYKEDKAINGNVMGMKINTRLPLSHRRVAIPMDATLKAYIDFTEFDDFNICRRGDKIEITLPEPKISLTNTKIEHENIRSHVDLLRGKFSNEELSQIESNGRNAILEEMGRMDIMGKARMSAANTLIPIITKFGYTPDDITITFSTITKRKGIRQLLEREDTEG